MNLSATFGKTKEAVSTRPGSLQDQEGSQAPELRHKRAREAWSRSTHRSERNNLSPLAFLRPSQGRLEEVTAVSNAKTEMSTFREHENSRARDTTDGSP